MVLSKLKPFEPRSPDFAEQDSRPLGQEAQIDTLILLSLVECGRPPPWALQSGLCVGKGEMVDLATNGLIWRARMDTLDGTVRVEGEWNQAPDFPNLTAAIYKSIDQAWDFLVKDFFKTPEALTRAPRSGRVHRYVRVPTGEPGGEEADAGGLQAVAVAIRRPPR